MAEGGIPGIRAKMRRLHIPDIEEDEFYSMNLPRMGHALIINNVEFEFPGSRMDVQVLVEAFTKIGFEVDCKYNCSWEEMVKLKRWILDENNHKNCNCFVLVIISHGNEQGYVTDKSKTNAWRVEDFVKELSVVETLLGRPKVMIVNACRGKNFNSGNVLPKGALSHLANPDLESLAYLPDKSDMFLTFPTVPGYIAYAGDESGSPYLQAFATYLERHHKQKDLATIHEMVTRYVSTMKQGETQVMNCPEFRSALRYKLRFSEFKNTCDSVTVPEVATTANTTAATTSRTETATVAATQEHQQQVQTAVRGPTLSVSPKAESQVMRCPEFTSTQEYKLRFSGLKRSRSASRPDAAVATTTTTETTVATQQQVQTTIRGPILDVSPKIPHIIKMDLISTHETELQFWGRTRFAIMQTTGDVIIWGIVAINPVSHLYNIWVRKRSTQAAFHIYNKTSKRFKKRVLLQPLCEHEDSVQMLPVKVNHGELLAVSCRLCQMIRLLDITSGNVIQAFHDPGYYPGSMCAGEGDVMYVVHNVKGYPMLELDTAQLPFTGPHTKIQSRMDMYYSLCYIPPPYRLIVITDHSPGILRAVSVDSSECMWEVREEIDGMECDPHDLLFSPRHQVLLVADGRNSRVLALHPGDGSHLQTIKLHQHLGAILQLSLLQNQLIVHHNAEQKVKVSYFSVN